MASRTSTSASALAPLPIDFLVGPPKDLSPRISKIDFAKTELPEYAGLYAIVIDNIFTIQECEELVRLAEAQTNGRGWERAMVNIGGGRQAMYEDTRKCGRIIFDTSELASRMWERVAPLIPEILRLEGEAQVMGWGPVKRGEVWTCVGLNERLRLLKYVGGEFFKAHCDGCYEAPTKERSYYTLHLYLNDSEHQPRHSESNSEPLVGGATTFFGDTMKTRLDVEPKVGRVLVFQQRGLLHAGDDVVSGLKLTLRTDVMYEKSGQVAEEVKRPKDVMKKQPGWVKDRRGGAD